MNFFDTQAGHDFCHHLIQHLQRIADVLEQKTTSSVLPTGNNKNISPELQVHLDIQETMKCFSSDYSSRILSIIEDEVAADVMECSDFENGVWSSGDISLAIGRVLCSRLGIEI